MRRNSSAAAAAVPASRGSEPGRRRPAGRECASRDRRPDRPAARPELAADNPMQRWRPECRRSSLRRGRRVRTRCRSMPRRCAPCRGRSRRRLRGGRQTAVPIGCKLRSSAGDGEQLAVVHRQQDIDVLVAAERQQRIDVEPDHSRGGGVPPCRPAAFRSWDVLRDRERARSRADPTYFAERQAAPRRQDRRRT